VVTSSGPNIGIVLTAMEEYIPLAQRADQLGFHSMWLTERLFKRFPPRPGVSGTERSESPQPAGWASGFDPPPGPGVTEGLCFATSRIRIGLSDTNLAPRQSFLEQVQQFASLDRLSGGRLMVGVAQNGWPGEAGPNPSEALLTRLVDGTPAPGAIPIAIRPNRMWARQGGRLEESITAMQRLWSGEEVSFRGSHHRLDGVSLPVVPAQSGGIPLLVGGTTAASVRLAATRAAGCVHPSGGIPEEMGPYIQVIRQLAEQAGRDPASLHLGKLIYLSLDDDRARARLRLTRLQSFWGPRYNIDAWCAFGPPAECAAFLRRFLDAGINLLLLAVPWPRVEDLERLHQEVLPLLA
jgi:alkanesulfonate monooxygenase SsuD/methylene tetrahydromethanopterin reductase-like flavin-dependent oxidoreductase (luciferase family)